MKRRKDLQTLKADKLGVHFGLTPDERNFEACFQHIDDILKVLADELDQQLKDEHMIYDVELDGKVIKFDGDNDRRKRREIVIWLIEEALITAVNNAVFPIRIRVEHKDPWSRIKGFMALRLSKEDVASPIRAEEYEVIKEIAIEAERQKPINLESIPVNMQRPEWTEAEQMELLMKKEKE